MVFLPGGHFRMGSREDPSEEPAHFVQIRPFWMGKYPVTVGEWHACVAGGGCKDISDSPREPDQPMANVSWRDAMAYVQWLARTTGLSYRLPTEAEWEYAARAGNTTRYWWGDEIGAGHADCHGCGSFQEKAGPLKVGSLPPNRFGLFDMGGDVAGWVADCWHDNYMGAPANGAAWECQAGGDHVLRGGSWMSTPSVVRVSDREHYDTDVRYPGNGFRVARSQ
jgi:formylglycine-generating enzyme required for sulfatase activity